MWKITIKSISIRNIMISLMFFLVIFNPPFLPRFSFTIIFTIISLLYCLLYYEDTANLINGTYQRRWFRQFVVFYIYYFIVSVISSLSYSYYDSPFTTFIGSVVGVISLFLVSLFLCLFVFRKGEGFDSLTDYIINAGVIESVFGIAAFLSPGVKSLLNGITIANSRSEKIVHAVGTATFRNYGIASTLFDSFGFGMSIMALLALYKALGGKPRYYVYFAMISFVAIINARTSMVLIVAGSAIIVLGQSAKTLKAIVGKVIIILFAFFVVSLISSYVERGSANAQWLSTGIDEIKALFTGRQTTGTFITLFRDIYFPDDILQAFIGVGLTPAQAIRKTVDMGYIQNLWMFGVIGSLMLYYFYIKPIILWGKYIKSERILAVAIGVVMAAFLIKLNLFGYGISTVVIMTLFLGRLSTLTEYGIDYSLNTEC